MSEAIRDAYCPACGEDYGVGMTEADEPQAVVTCDCGYRDASEFLSELGGVETDRRGAEGIYQ